MAIDAVREGARDNSDKIRKVAFMITDFNDGPRGRTSQLAGEDCHVAATSKVVRILLCAEARLKKGFAMKPTNLSLCSVATALLLSSTAWAADAPSPQKFLSTTMQDGLAEVQACKLALEKSSNPAVKDFAQRMIADHSATNEKVTKLAKSKNIPLPDSPSAKDKATYEALKIASGSTFDKAFMKHNVSDHEKDIKEFTKEAAAATDPDVKSFASETLSTLKEHLKRARDINERVKNES
jgi:putative membrane protein